MRKIVFRSPVAGVGLAVLGLAAVAIAAPVVKESIKHSKFFKVDVAQKHVTGTGDYIAPALKLDLTSTTTDQPQYWPNEKVYLKVIALHRPGQTLKGSWQKRDATNHTFDLKLNSDGVAVLELMDGSGKTKLELGEYRVDLESEDKKTKTSTTFAVVEGSLGAISFAHEWKRVTTVPELESTNGAWFIGNASGQAGARWGNGLSFKNEIRIANQPFTGHATINSRCMLPGCNGTFAGRTLEMDVKGGKIEGTLDVGGHSGPFQIEVVTPQGSLRHQFEGSSHVEREMLVVSGGMGDTHRIGLAPYENTKQVPGRQLYVESKSGSDGDVYSLKSIVATKGALSIEIKKAVKHARLTVWEPKTDGTYTAKDVQTKVELAAGTHLSAPIAGPFTLVTIGGFVDGKFKEAWALGFTPSDLSVAVTVPPSGAPNQPLTVEIAVKGTSGKVTGILEVYDNRVASKSAGSPLGSALGDSVRSTSRAVSSWSDETGIVEEQEEPKPTPNKRPRSVKMKKEMSTADADSIGLGSIGTVGHASGTGSGYGYGSGAMGGRSSAQPMALAAPSPMPMKSRRMSNGAVSTGGGGGGDDEDNVPKDIIREGEKKVVACQLVETDANGKASVTVTLPPQTGRVTARFVAVKGLDYAEAQTDSDVKLGAFADARLPRVLVPGAELTLKIDVTNNLSAPVNLIVKGTGVAQELRRPIAPGHESVEVPFSAKVSGTLVVQLADANGKAIDRRELPVSLLGDQQVTYSRLEFGSGVQGQSIKIAPNEDVVVYSGAGPLLKGIVTNVFTTTESWFGHAEALSAQAAVHAVLLASIDKGLLSDDGIGEQLRSTLNKAVRSLDEKFCDKTDGLCRAYPGMATNPLWSMWVSHNLHSVVRALDKTKIKDQRVAEAYALAKQMVARIDGALATQHRSTQEAGGYDASGEDVVPVEIDGKVVYRVLTDDAVSRWAADKLFAKIDFDAASSELSMSKAYDAFRFLKAFERTGSLQYMTEIAEALYVKGDRAKFAQLYRLITRGMILTQEPGLLQGPALLGGVYSTPMALVKFLELQLLIDAGSPTKAKAVFGGSAIAYGERKSGGGTLILPAGAIARVDQKRRVSWDGGQGIAKVGSGNSEVATTNFSTTRVRIGDEIAMETTLSNDLDPAEYYAIVAVPSTVAIKQTDDILSDYKGQLIYGQQVTGGTRMQLLAIPFRGSRTMKLTLEGAYAGHSPGKVIVRHIEKVDSYAARTLPEITVE